jgi:hypothetical protein
MKYNNYFSHWKDYTLLVGAIALISLFLSIIDYEYEFNRRGPTGEDIPKKYYLDYLAVHIVSLLGIVAIGLQWRL